MVLDDPSIDAKGDKWAVVVHADDERHVYAPFSHDDAKAAMKRLWAATESVDDIWIEEIKGRVTNGGY